MRLLYPIVVFAIAVPAFAQKYEFGLHGGGSFGQTKKVSSPRGEANAGFASGYSAGLSVGHNMYEHVGGELRYTFQQHDMKASGGSQEAKFGSQSHAIHYDFLIHGAGREARVRPYVAVGGGFKAYRGTGTESAFQPLSNIVILTKTNETVGMLSIGGGVKMKITDKMVFRVDIHDYLTQFPKKLLTPASGATVKGWLNNFVPTAGITFIF